MRGNLLNVKMFQQKRKFFLPPLEKHFSCQGWRTDSRKSVRFSERTYRKDITVKRQFLTACIASLFALPAAASSDDAWKAFSAEVQARCLGAVEGNIEKPKIVVDPFGSQSYGLAIITGKAKGAATEISHVCVFDKTTKTVEISGELPQDAVKIDIPDSAAR
ncbi:hypothetical protein [Agrobacterium rosae]|uniref:hypothetical protein n=1 Tax=Agrobacterium rosae TaxID=1972867 RepID=UPI00314509F1